MIKAFENLEVWFVTGAQLLYGGETVKIVDGHSKEMVDGLNNSGIIPIKVVYKGTANSSAEVEAIMKASNNDDSALVSSPGCTPSHPPRCGSRAFRL